MKPPTRAALARAAAEASPEALARAMRVLAAEDDPGAQVTEPAALAKVALSHLGGLEHEALVVIALDRRLRVVESDVLTVGSSGFTIVDSPQILRWVLTRRRPATAFALAHNHPSGDPAPSVQDRDVTKRVAAAARAVGLGFVDHLVVVDSGRWSSLAAEGLCGVGSPSIGWTG